MIRHCLGRLSAADLRELAWLLDRRQSDARRSLKAEGIERLAEVLANGRQPAIGLFRRYDAQGRARVVEQINPTPSEVAAVVAEFASGPRAPTSNLGEGPLVPA